MKPVFLAPLEGIGNHIYRSAFTRHYAGVDRFYTPFLDVGAEGSMKNRCKKDILPENNPGQKLIPQVLTKYPEAVSGCAKILESFGYDEININMGCPYGTVVSKGKGAALLLDSDKLKYYLEESFKKCPIDISLKIRIGMYDISESAGLLEIFNEYPLKELIIHPRLQKEFYDGNIHEDILDFMYKNSKNPVCINPGVKTTEEYDYYQRKYPNTTGIMIGRGIISNPQLAENIAENKAEKIDLHRFREFHDDLLFSYRSELSGDVPVLFKMKELWTYWKTVIYADEKKLKEIRKSGSINEYRMCVSRLF